MFPDPFGDVEPDSEPTGNTAACYICGRSFQWLPPEYVIRRDHEYGDDPGWTPRSKKARAKMTRYFLTFCLWCAHSHKL